MRRFAALLFIVSVALAWVGCGGGKSSTTPTTASKIVMSPSTLSLNLGEAQPIFATIQDSAGGDVTGTVAFSASGTGVDVSNVGTCSGGGNCALVCAGTWNNRATPTICTPATGAGSGSVVATFASVTGTTPVFVHVKVDKVEISSGIDLANCVSQGATATFSALACSGTTKPGTGGCSQGTDVTAKVGPFVWSVNPTSPAKLDTTGKCSTDNTCVITAATPGQTSVMATLQSAPGDLNSNNVSSLSVPFTTCPIKAISLHTSGGTDTSVSLAPAGTQAISTDVTDTKGKTISSVTLNFFTSQPATATATSGLVTAVAAGQSTIGTSCTPPNCNVGFSPIYSNTFLAKVSGTSASTVYVASPTSTSLLPIDTGTNTAGTAITLPNMPNSAVFAPNGLQMFMGSDGGLMTFDSNTSTVTTNSAVTGKVLGVSPDSGTVAVATATTVTLVSVSGAANVSFPVTNARRLDWSPDMVRLYIVNDNGLSVFTANTTLRTFPGAIKDVDFLSQGPFAYVAGGAAPVTVYSTCDNGGNNTNVKQVNLAATPAFVRTLPNSTGVLALYPSDLSTAAPRFLDSIAVSTDAVGCPPAVTNTAGTPTALGTFTPGQLIITPDGSKAFVTATDAATVIAYDVATGAATPIQLAGTGVTGATTGGTTLDSAFLYVGAAGTNTVHRVDTATGNDLTQISISFSPDFVVVRPK